MSKKRILSAIIFVCGIALIGFSMYVTKGGELVLSESFNAPAGLAASAERRRPFDVTRARVSIA